MPVVSRALASLVLVLVLAVPALAQQSPGPSRAQGTSTPPASIDARFRLTDAIERTERDTKGRAVEASMTPFPKGGGALEVTAMRPDGSMVKHRVDANTGDTVNATEQTIESYVTGLDFAALAGAKISMRQAVEAAEAHLAGGAAIGAEVQSAEGGVSYEITVLKDGAETDLVVGPDGKVTEG